MQVGRIGKTTVILNDYFIILLGVYFLLGVLPQALMLFTAVAWHEGWHTVVAGCLGWRVLSIELFPFGGVSRLQKPVGDSLLNEFYIALAGPAASFLMAVVLIPANFFIETRPDWLVFFGQANLIIGIFNLWPGLPLDGGRIYRVLRARKAGMARATLEGVYGGTILAFLLGAASIGGYYLRLIDLQGLALAMFIYYAARQEGEAVPYMFWKEFWQRRSLNAELKPVQAYWLAASSDSPVIHIVNSFVSRSFNLVVVINKDGGLVGILTEAEILQKIMERGTNFTLGDMLKK